MIARIAIGSIALGLAVLLVSNIIFRGFRGQIQEKIFTLAGHIEVSKFDLRNSYEDLPVSTNTFLYRKGGQIKNVAHIQKFGYKAGLLKTDDEVMGVVLKGVGSDFDTARFAKHLIEGKVADFTEEKAQQQLILSRKIADKLILSIGDEVLMYFVQDPPRARKFTICGIYETGIEDFDEKIVLGDLRVVQRLNSWADTLVGGYEVFLDDFNQLDYTFERVYDQMDYDLQIEKVTDKYVHLFDWFLMVNRNVTIFLGIMLFVACFNIVSIVLILIMERTPMIGTLKALGASNWLVQKVFILNGLRMTLNGLLIGNIIGIGFGLIQKTYKIIPLDPENYYMDTVPIAFSFQAILNLNLLLVGLIAAILLLPTLVITRIDPIRSIKFD